LSRDTTQGRKNFVKHQKMEKVEKVEKEQQQVMECLRQDQALKVERRAKNEKKGIVYNSKFILYY